MRNYHLFQGFGLLQNVRYSDQCLRVSEKSVDNDAKLEIATCDPTQADQQFDVECWAVSVFFIKVQKYLQCLCSNRIMQLLLVQLNSC